MKVKLKSVDGYVGLSHLVGNTFDAVKVNGYYSGYYVEVPISSTKTTSLYFLHWEVEEVDEYVEELRNVQSLMMTVPVVVIILFIIFLICNLIINLYV
jgi:hypothetical protein